MTTLNDHLWNLVDTLGEGLEGYLFDDDRLERHVQNGVQAFGAGLLGQKPRLTALDERTLFRLGRHIQNQIEHMKTDRAARSEQRRQIAAVQKRKIKKLSQLQRMDPYKFEYWVAGYFKKRRFRNVVVTQLSADFGIDVSMTCPNGAKAVVQVKRYKGAVGRPVVQQTYGAMHLVKAKRCYVVTSGRFAHTARALEKEHKDIILIDGQQLMARK